MSMGKVLRTTALASAVIAGSAIAVAPWGNWARAQTEFNVGLSVPDVAHLALYVAEEKGFLEAEGLKVQFVQFESDAASAQGLTAGAVHINAGSIAAVLNSFASDRDLTAFWSESNLPGYVWYGQPKFNSIKDLKGGGKIGVSSMASLSHRISEWAVKESGMDPEKDVAWLAVGGPLERVAALKAGQVDAIPATAPGMYILEEEGFKALLKLEDVLPEFEYETFYARKATLTSHADAIKAFLRGYIKGVRWASENPEETTTILMKKLGAEENQRPIYRRTVDWAVKFTPEDGHFAERSIDVFLEFYKTGGRIAEVPPDHSAFVDYSFIEHFKSNPVK